MVVWYHGVVNSYHDFFRKFFFNPFPSTGAPYIS